MLEQASLAKLPEYPYKGLDYYEAVDGPLLAGRDGDAARCAELIGSAVTKVLILQGRSGAGKSSFLRAALLPRLQRHRFGYQLLRDSGKGEPLLIRSTGHPVRRIHEALVNSIRVDPELREFAAHTVPYLDIPERESESAAACIEIVRTISSGIPKRLLIVLDQAEEVLTQGSRRDRDLAVRTLVRFLLRIVRFDVKLIVSMRTEYHGQLAEILGRVPIIGRAPEAGIADYMLNSFIHANELVDLIERPTGSDPIEHNGVVYEPPFSRYNFKYGQGVALAIAHDLVDHCGDSSPPPIMQIVCRSLYDEA